MNKKQLWLRIHAYQFDHVVPPNLADRLSSAFGGEGASLRAFAAKIARKLGWESSFSLRAVKEYKKFLYLGIVANFVVTPPRVLDQVWHEHLLFTRAYREFCDQVLGRPFDHNPELLPSADQTEAYEAQYNATLALYAIEFGYEPPMAFWGTPKFESRARESVAPTPSTAGNVYANDPPLILWTDSSLTSTFAPFDHGDTSHPDSSSVDTSGADTGGSDGGGGCSSGCGGGD